MYKIFLLLLALSILTAAIANEENETKAISIPALGRPFKLGCLYDQKNDELLSCSFNLWKEDTLKKYVKKTYHPHEKIHAITTEKMHEKKDAFSIDASITANFLSGKLTVEGSAEYLNIQTESNYEAAVGFKYDKTTHTKTIGQDKIFQADYIDRITMFAKATHVVNSITYGGSAIFSFKNTLDNKLDKKIIQGRLKVGLTISFVTVEGTVDLNFTNAQHKEFSTFSSVYRGDIKIKSQPKTFAEAIEAFKTIPGLLTEANSKPVTVGLLPIRLLNSDEARLVRSIKQDVLEQFNNQMEEYQVILRQIGDILHEPIGKKLILVKGHAIQFRKALQKHMIDFQEEMAKLLVKARENEAGELNIVKLITNPRKCPMKNLFYWIEKKRDELSVLKRAVEWKHSVVLANEAIIYSETYVLMLKLKIYPMEDNFSACLMDVTQIQCSEYQSWFNGETGAQIRDTVNMFINTIEAILGTKKFSTRGLKVGYGILEQKNSDGETPSASIEYLKDAFSVNKNIKLPQIENLMLDFNCFNYILTWESKIYINEAVKKIEHKVRYRDANSSDWKYLTTAKNKAEIDPSNLFLEQTNISDSVIEVQVLISCIFGYCGWVKRNFSLGNDHFRMLREKCELAKCGLSDNCKEYEDCEESYDELRAVRESTCSGSDGCRFLTDSHLASKETLRQITGIFGKHECCNDCIKEPKCVGFLYHRNATKKNTLEHVCTLFKTLNHSKLTWKEGVVGGFIQERLHSRLAF